LPSYFDFELVVLSLGGATGGLESEEDDAFSVLGISEEEGGLDVIISN
jgi:hypothetical protein